MRGFRSRMGNHFTPPRFILVSLLHVWLCCCSFMKPSSTSALNCSSIERNALIDFKQNLLDPSVVLSSWVDYNCCEWHGITCDFISGKVTKIDLQNRDLPISLYNRVYMESENLPLRGKISSSLLDLHYLSYLDLSFNNFEGASIPYFFGMFKNLRYLNLCNANFHGDIPPNLGNLSNLNYLDLSQNGLHVENLNWLSGLSSLEHLGLGWVNLSKAQENWMNEVNKVSSLKHLDLTFSYISSLDSSTGLQNLTSLRVLELSSRYDLSNSSLPLWLTNLTSLTKLDLSYFGFHGTISPDFVKLKNLQHLDLAYNNLRNTGNQKPIFSLLNLCKLESANLARNSLGGRLDELLGTSSNCTHNNLESLDLSYNELEGEIPNSLGVLDKLQYLLLTNNKLWGSLPNSIGNLSSLQEFKLSFNNFSGIIPPNLGQLSQLISFESYDNSWKGVMTEAHFVNLTKLESLIIRGDTYHEALVFNVSYNWIPPFRLKALHLRNCLVGPQFPIWLQVQTKLIHDVTISYAGISDFIPNEWISHASSQITLLDLSNNCLKGNLSQLLISHTHLVNRRHKLLGDHLIPVRYPNLMFLFLENNLFSGSIPQNISDAMPKLKYLSLSKNHLNGKINPSSLEKMNSTLEVLSLSNNQFFGELSNDWDKLNSLAIIDLANNNLYGKIPSSIGLKSLHKLILSNNNFFGEIPKSLENCSDLQSIDLSGNRLHGSFPVWTGEVFSQLQLISLRSNLFNGTIPRHWCNLLVLRILDLSDNNLVGEVPNCLSNWTSLIYNNNEKFDYFSSYYRNTHSFKEKAVLVLKGRELEYDSTLKYVLIINLSRNKLSGEIPFEITKLVQLGTLNLSNNELVGVIPKNIGAMQKLETLDLSCNNLSGEIPTSLGSISSLSHLNLSFNNFTGTIPTSNQLQTLNDSSIYEGNRFLHPAPQRNLPSDENTNSIYVPTSEANAEEKDLEMFSFFISMAIGFPIGLNILFFAIFTSESRRISYFCFVDRISHNILEKVDNLANCFKRKRS